MLPAIILFAVTYVLMLTLSKYRTYIALASGALFVIFGMLICASFIPNKPDITNGLICCVLLVIGLVYNFGRKKNMNAIIPAYIYLWLFFGV